MRSAYTGGAPAAAFPTDAWTLVRSTFEGSSVDADFMNSRLDAGDSGSSPASAIAVSRGHITGVPVDGGPSPVLVVTFPVPLTTASSVLGPPSSLASPLATIFTSCPSTCSSLTCEAGTGSRHRAATSSHAVVTSSPSHARTSFVGISKVPPPYTFYNPEPNPPCLCFYSPFCS